jgi:hypothetical protein
VVIIDLSAEEKELLKEYFKSSPLTLIRLKAQAIVMRDNGFLLSADITPQGK